MHGCRSTAYEVALHWVAQQDVPVVVLSASASHLASNRDTVSGTWALSPSEMWELSNLTKPAGRPSHWGQCEDVDAPVWGAANSAHLARFGLSSAPTGATWQ